MGDDVLLVDGAGTVAEITLNRPESGNSLNLALLAAVRAALQEADADEGIDVILVTGTDPAFCAGLDLDELASPERGPELATAMFESSRLWDPLSKPVIGAINGPAERGGLELALHCDILIASERATFADPHTRLGVVPSLGLTVSLPRAVGTGWANRMSLTGDAVLAEQALRIGLVTEVVPHESLLLTARGLAAAIVSNDQTAVRALLRSYHAVADAAALVGLRIELETHAELLRGQPPEPVRDAILAVLESRSL